MARRSHLCDGPYRESAADKALADAFELYPRSSSRDTRISHSSAVYHKSEPGRFGFDPKTLEISLRATGMGVPSYSREEFLTDLISEAEQNIRRCLESGASVAQIDFTEGRLALKFDPSGQLVKQFIDVNNQVLARLFSGREIENRHALLSRPRSRCNPQRLPDAESVSNHGAQRSCLGSSTRSSLKR